jgi:hypothetical protein
MKIQNIELFPTHLLRVDVSDFISDEDRTQMMMVVDELIDAGQIQPCPPAPLYQTNPILFRDDSHEVFRKLRESFINACFLYVQNVNDFSPNQSAIEPAGVGAWAYKGWKELNSSQENPWHNHNPSYLSGVYYLKVPGDGTKGGTEFHDPRTVHSQGTRHQEVLPIENSWTIFPGWLYHKTSFIDSSDSRYVIAANLYVRVVY